MASTASARAPKRSGKENAPPVRSIKPVRVGVDVDDEFEEEGDSFGAFSVDEAPLQPAKPLSKSSSQPTRPIRSSKLRPTEEMEEVQVEAEGEQGKGEKRGGDLQRRLTAMTAERDRLRIQRDTFTKQFEELSKTRSTDIEGVFEKYKEKAGLQAKAQNDIISSLTESNEKLQARAQTLEKALAAAKEASTTLPSAGGVFEATPAPAKADPKEVKALKEELAKAQAALKEKDEKISSLERECKAEVEHSRSLQAAAKSGPAASLAASVSTTPEEADKDSQSLKLYEDMTDLNIMNVKIKSGGKNGKEVTFNCVQTVEGRSLNFKLRAYNELDPELVAVKSDNPWVKSVVYQPISLEYETDTDFIKRLGIFASEFSVRKEQLGVLWENLKSRISVNGVLEDMEG